MYRAMNYKILFLMSCTLVLSACGQSGALYMPKDQDHDKRAKYLLYKEKTVAPMVEQQAPASTPSNAVAESTTP